MIFVPTPIEGAFIIEPEPVEDERGFFARIWCEREFRERGLEYRHAQSSISFNLKKGILRGLHYQVAPHSETKLVRCTRGSLYDVIVDLRPSSSTFKKSAAVILSQENRRMLYIPENVAHGFQTLEHATEVCYQISEFYHPECARGIRWDDPAFHIEWPSDNRTISSKDLQYLDFQG